MCKFVALIMLSVLSGYSIGFISCMFEVVDHTRYKTNSVTRIPNSFLCAEVVLNLLLVVSIVAYAGALAAPCYTYFDMCMSFVILLICAVSVWKFFPFLVSEK